MSIIVNFRAIKLYSGFIEISLLALMTALVVPLLGFRAMGCGVFPLLLYIFLHMFDAAMLHALTILLTSSQSCSVGVGSSDYGGQVISFYFLIF